MANEIELAWAAGFFDGEGSTYVYTTYPKRGRSEGYLHFFVKVGQKDPEVLHRFAAAMGFGNVTGPHRNGELRCRTYTWQVSGTKARAALDLLWPYLSRLKREQATRCIEKMDERNELPRVTRKRRIISLRDRGLKPPEIAQEVGLSVRTVYYHLATPGEGVT